MKHEILYRPSYSIAKVSLEQGESLMAESGAMVSMSGGVEIETKMKGGLFGALKRSVLGGESFFMNTFTANQAGELILAPSTRTSVDMASPTGRRRVTSCQGSVDRTSERSIVHVTL